MVVNLIFTLTWFILLIWGIRTMSKGWGLMTQQPQRKYDGEIKETTKTVTKVIHPEMADVKPGDQLMVVNFGEEEPRDPLYQSMQDRIETLREERRTEDDEEDDEDDGGDVVISRV